MRKMILIVCVALLFSACGGSDDKASNDSASNGTTTTEQASSSKAEPLPDEPKPAFAAEAGDNYSAYRTSVGIVWADKEGNAWVSDAPDCKSDPAYATTVATELGFDPNLSAYRCA